MNFNLRVFLGFGLLLLLGLAPAESVPNADDQCRILLNNTGATFCQNFKSSLCSSIACRLSGSALCVSMSFGAAEGTVCGSNNMTCSNGNCVQGSVQVAGGSNDQCIYGDDIVDQTVIPDALPAPQMNCADVIAFLVQQNKSPLDYCNQPAFKQACCQTCKLYESLTCRDLFPASCEALTATECLSPNSTVNGLTSIVACARSCKACTDSPIKCSPFLCMNGASCSNVTADANSLIGFKCTCQAGFYGQFCELKDPCSPNPCKNNGVCEKSGTTEYKCTCAKGFTGSDCARAVSPLKASLALDLKQSVYPNPCYPNPCSGNAQCVLYTFSSYYCVCPAGYYGNLCQFQNGCFNNPCLNGGVCQSTQTWPNYYTCSCPAGYYGQNCQFCNIFTTTTTTTTTTQAAPTNCVDANANYCYAVKINNYCNTVYGQLCPVSCGRCCFDSQASCPYWSSYCSQIITINPNLCRKTCGLC